MTQAAKGDGATLILRVESEVPADLEKAIAEKIKAESFQVSLD